MSLAKISKYVGKHYWNSSIDPSQLLAVGCCEGHYIAPKHKIKLFVMTVIFMCELLNVESLT